MRMSAMGLVAALVLVTGASAQEVSPAAPAEIQFWTTETQSSRVATIRFLMNAFEAEHNVRVKIRAIDEENLLETARAEAATGNLGGVIQAESDTMLAMAGEGLLDTRLASDVADTLGRNGFAKGALTAFRMGSAMVGVPLQAWVQGIWYREDWFREAKLGRPENWPAILKAAQYFNNPVTQRYGIGIGTEPSNYAYQTFAQFCPPHLDVGDSRKGLGDAMRMYSDLLRLAPPSGRATDMRDMFLSNRLAMIVYSSFMFSDIALGVEGKLPPAPSLVNNARFLAGTTENGGAPFGLVEGLGFSRFMTDEQRKIAAALANFLFREPAYLTWLHMAPGGMLPVRPEITQTETFYNDWGGVYRRFGPERIRGLVEKVELIRGNPLNSLPSRASHAETASILATAIARLAAGNLDPDGASEWVLAELAKPR